MGKTSKPETIHSPPLSPEMQCPSSNAGKAASKCGKDVVICCNLWDLDFR
jgi:hypothetical protein